MRSSKWWVATILIVTAGLGAGLILAEFVSAMIDHSASKVPSSVIVIFVAGALGGIWGGAYLAGRLTRGTTRRFLAAGVSGVLGLVVGLGLIKFHTNFLGFLQAVIALLLPGSGAAVGSWLAQRGAPGQRLGPPPPAAKGGKASGTKGARARGR